jgi:hypothetical protein
MSSKPEKEFEEELQCFHREIERGIQAFYAEWAIHSIASANQQVLDNLDATPYFWQTVLYSLRTAYFIILGRIFDQSSQHNVGKLLKISQNNLEIFNRASLANRKRASSNNADPWWLPQYLRDAYEPKPSDFIRLSKYVARRRKIYENAYRDIRNKIFAHKVILSKSKFDDLYKKTNVGEMGSLFVFLSRLHLALLELYYNGRKPILIKLPYSVRMLLKKKENPWGGTTQELIVRDTRILLKDMLHTENNAYKLINRKQGHPRGVSAKSK